jgi:hypothetical protein
MALMFTCGLPKTLVFYHRTLVFLPVCNSTADLQKPSKQLQIQCSFVRRFAPSMQSSAHCPIDFRRLGWVRFRRKSNQPDHGYPEAYLEISLADKFTSVMAQVAFRLAQNSDCPETKMITASNQSPSGYLRSKLRRRTDGGLYLYFG